MSDDHQRLKLCPFCEGRLDFELTECIYCGAALLHEKKSSAARDQDYTEENLAHFYAPPYQGNGASESSYFKEEPSEEERKVYSYNEHARGSETAIGREALAHDNREEKSSSSLFSLLLLSIGGQIFTLGWLLFFFSEGGLLQLEWKARFWFAYILLSLPFFYLGWKKLTQDE